MSYCRWSTILPNGHCSDLYIYDAEGYISVNVASGRGKPVTMFEEPLLERHRLKYATLTGPELAAYVASCEPIDLPHAGESVGFTGPEQAVAFLRKLRALGYRMPDDVLDVTVYEGYDSDPASESVRWGLEQSARGETTPLDLATLVPDED